MIDIRKFKPDLIPNAPKGKSFEETIFPAIEKNGGYEEYLATLKKDGCRLQLIEGYVKTRSLKAPKSKLVIERFQPLADLCKELNIAVDGEFYMDDLKFREIFRFFSNEDVTRPKVRAELKKLKESKPEKYARDYGGRSIDWLTTFHEDLNFWLFDGIVLDRPDLVGYKERIFEIVKRLCEADAHMKFNLETPDFFYIKNSGELIDLYKNALHYGHEGLVLTHKDHQYKFGRNTLNQGTILKMKDDNKKYDGIVIAVEEATQVKEGVEKTTNELGRSVTSKKKDDRKPSGMAKGFIVQFEDIGTFCVQLKGFDHDERREILENADKYIGRHFMYTGMKPDKDFPRSAFFSCWRDDK